MKKLLVLFAILFTILISFQIIAQKVESPLKSSLTTIPEKIQQPLGPPLPAGTYTIGTGGYFPSIDSAFNKLSIDGIAGEVILELIDDLYQAEDNSCFLLEGPIQGADSSNRVIIRPAENKNVVVEGNAYDVFYFKDVSYLTLDGIGLNGPTTLTVRSIYPNVPAYAINFQNNSDYNVIKNITVTTENYINGVGIYLWVGYAGTDNSPDYNLIENNFIKEAGTGIFLQGGASSNPVKRPKGNIIRGNKIGSETDSLIAWGIQSMVCQNTVIENNIVQNVRNYKNYVCPPINAFGDHGSIIRNNVVHNIYESSGTEWGVHGISLTGNAQLVGVNNLVYNNMIYDIRSTAPQADKEVAGIKIWFQDNPGIYFNSINLSGTGPGYNGSAALYIRNNCTDVNIFNNILINTRIDSPKCASSIFVMSGSTITSDFNDLHYTPSQYNSLVKIQATDYLTLADWQTTGNDPMSINEMPFFNLPDLHLNNTIASNIEGRGVSITGIDTDYDNQVRSTTTPDIGADEIDGLIPNIWQPQYTYQPSNIWPVKFSTVSDEICWATGYSLSSPIVGTFFRTTNGGVNWRYGTIPGTETFRSDCIFAKDINTAYVVTGNVGFTGGTGIYKTIDGGLTWQKHPTAYLSSYWEVCYIHFFDNNNGVAIGQPKNQGELYYEIYTTSDDGMNWNRVPDSNIPIANINAFVSFPGMSAFGNSIWVPTVANSPLGNPRIYKSTNKGLTWSVKEIVLPNASTRQYWLGLAFENETTGILTTAHSSSTEAIIKKTTDGGSTWFDITKPVNIITSNSISTIPGIVGGYVVCGDVNDGTAYTLDGGNSWNLLDNKANFFPHFHSATAGWSIEYPSRRIDKYIGPPIPLPVELISFNAQAENQKVILRWATATELNNNGFEIQRRVAESDFATIGFVKGEGTTTNQKEYSYTDKELTNGKYSYRLKQVDFNGSYEYSDVIEVEVLSIDEYALEQNFPNPFNPKTTIGYVLKEKTNAKLILLNAIGEEVAVLVNAEQDKGLHKVDFNASTLASGVYFYRIQAGDFVQTRKMILIK